MAQVDKQKLGLKRSGELMLSGWKMLAEHCPICSFALMEKGSSMRCPGCDLEVVRELFAHGDDGNEPTVTVMAPNAETPVVKDEQRQSYEEMKKDYDKKNKRRDEVSARLGERLLAGWTLLGSICPNPNCDGTPLMSAPDHHMTCVCCHERYTQKDSGELIPVLQHTHHAPIITESSNESEDKNEYYSFAQESKPEADWSKYDVNNAPFLPSFASNEDDPSVKIARKLLQGWKLLDEVCRKSCGGTVPLMQDGNGKKYCVICDEPSGTQPLPSKSEAILPPASRSRDRKITTRETRPRKSTSSHSSSSSSSPQSESSDSKASSSDLEDLDDEDAFLVQMRSREKSEGPSQPSTTQRDLANTVSFGKNRRNRRGKYAQAKILEKICTLADKLEHATASECCEMADAISKLAAAFGELKKI